VTDWDYCKQIYYMQGRRVRMVWMEPFFKFQILPSIISLEAQVRPALLLRIKLMMNLHKYFDCGYISTSHNLICSGYGREMCEICPRSV